MGFAAVFEVAPAANGAAANGAAQAAPAPDNEEDLRLLTEETWRPRTEEEVNATIHRWMAMLQPRAKSVFDGGSNPLPHQILQLVLEHIDVEGDPVMSNRCVHWHGEYDKTLGPVLKVDGKRVGLMRTLSFLFVQDAPFCQLAQLPPDKPLRNTCSNPRCILLNHVTL